MEATLQLHGGAALATLLVAMPDRLRDRVMRAAVRAGAVIVRDAARARAPLGHAPLPQGEAPGDLRKHIVVGNSRVFGDLVTDAVGVTRAGFYGRFVEFGTHSTASRTSRTGSHYRAHHATRAEPFMRPAADESAEAAAQAIIDAAGERIVHLAAGVGLVDPAEVDSGD